MLWVGGECPMQGVSEYSFEHVTSCRIALANAVRAPHEEAGMPSGDAF